MLVTPILCAIKNSIRTDFRRFIRSLVAFRRSISQPVEPIYAKAEEDKTCIGIFEGSEPILEVSLLRENFGRGRD
jgi:hypothetical protein